MKKLYTVRDVLAGYGVTVGVPAIIDLPNDQVAIRLIKGSCAKGAQANALNTNPEDKELWCVGEFNTETGEVIPVKPYLVGKAIEYFEGDRNGKVN